MSSQIFVYFILVHFNTFFVNLTFKIYRNHLQTHFFLLIRFKSNSCEKNIEYSLKMLRSTSKEISWTDNPQEKYSHKIILTYFTEIKSFKKGRLTYVRTGMMQHCRSCPIDETFMPLGVVSW